MKNKLFALILSVLLLPGFRGAYAAEVSSPYANLDISTNVVTISGVTPYGGGQIALSILRNDTLFYMRQTSSGNEGDFEFKIQMDPQTDESGIYKIYLGGAGLESTLLEYLFINAADSEEIVASVNNITSIANMKFIVTMIADKCGIDFEKGFNELEDKDSVYNALLNRTYESAASFRLAFDSGVAVQSFNEAAIEDAEELIARYGETLTLETAKGSNYAAINTKDLVYAAITGKNLPPAEPVKLKTEFNKACYVSLFNELATETREKMIQYIGECNSAGYTEISLADYSGLSDVDKAAVIKDVIKTKDKTRFTDLSDVAKAFRESVETVIQNNEKKARENEKKSGAGPGGGGGGVTKTVTVDDKIPVEAVKPDSPPEVGPKLPFDDIQSVPWAIDAIKYLSGKGILEGVGENKFEPDRPITREEFVKLLVLTLDLPAEDTEKSFDDVSEGAWYYEYVMRAYALNIVKGVDFDSFGVGTPVTREQMCTMLYRAMNFMDISIADNGDESNFTDNEAISDYALASVYALYRGGIVNGVGDMLFLPQGEATRAMAAKTLYSILQGGNLIEN